MKFEFKKTIGTNEFTFSGDFEKHTEFFEQVEFFSSLPSVGPNGETDLVVAYRSTKEGHSYYEVKCPSAKKVYKLGQSKAAPGSLFAKGWEDEYIPEAQNGAATQSFAAPAFAQPAAAPVATPAQPAPAFTQTAAPAPTPAAAPPVAPAAPVNPQVDTAAANVLAQFGIK